MGGRWCPYTACPVPHTPGLAWGRAQASLSSPSSSVEALDRLLPPVGAGRSPRKRTTSQCKSEPPLLRTSKRTIYTAGRPPWYNEHGTQSKEAFAIGEPPPEATTCPSPRSGGLGRTAHRQMPGPESPLSWMPWGPQSHVRPGGGLVSWLKRAVLPLPTEGPSCEAGTHSSAPPAGLGGGSASGKTTVARMIIEALDVPWVVLLSMDSFYKVRGAPGCAATVPRAPAHLPLLSA